MVQMTIIFNEEQKLKWGKGKWVNEPDIAEWKDVDTQLPCMVIRHEMGSLCGYVGVTKESALFGLRYDDAALESIDVHGDLTFSGNIKQSVIDNIDESLHWFGFDCAHIGKDYVPFMAQTGLFDVIHISNYRDVYYVSEQLRSLATQLAKKHRLQKRLTKK